MVYFEIGFDKSGGAILKTADYCHHYISGKHLARDVMALLEIGSTDGWEGNEHESQCSVDMFDDVLDQDDVRLAVAKGCYTRKSGYMHNEFFNELGLIDDES